MYLSVVQNETEVTARPPAVTPDSPALKLWIVLSRAYHALEVLVKADVARYGLTPTEFGALEALYHKGPLLLGSVQQKILVSSGGVTYVIDRLTEKGLVERQVCPTDRRASYAVLTQAGQALMQRIFPEHAGMVEQAMSGLTPEEQARAARLLRDLGLSAAGSE
jgi:MarR family 2-MHQ and catechol resistance regulon transcriptional repressor